MHSAVTTAPVNKAAVAAAFGRAAGHYDTVAHLQQKTGYHLRRLTTQALSGLLLPELHGLDAGCGTGFFSEQWKADCRCVTAFDLSPDMLAHARQQQRPPRNVQGPAVGRVIIFPDSLASVPNPLVQDAHLHPPFPTFFLIIA